jgi:protein-S-isoprenylcysteine O-methyltransferase Ste14
MTGDLLSRQVNDILGQMLIVAFFAVMMIIPLVIMVLGIMNFRRDKMRQVKSVLQALGALAIWTFVTFVMVMIFFMTVFSYPVNSSRSNELIADAIYFGGSFIYFLIGGVLVYWTKRQMKRMPAMGLSC